MLLKRNLLTVLYSIIFLAVFGLGFVEITYLAISHTSDRNIIACFILLGILIYLIAAFFIKESRCLEFFQQSRVVLIVLEALIAVVLLGGMFYFNIDRGMENSLLITLLLASIYFASRMLGGRIGGLSAIVIGFFFIMSISNMSFEAQHYINTLAMLIPFGFFLLVTKKIGKTFVNHGFIIAYSYIALAIVFSLAIVANPLVCALLIGCTFSLVFAKPEKEGSRLASGPVCAGIFVLFVAIILFFVDKFLLDLYIFPSMEIDGNLLKNIPLAELGKYIVSKYTQAVNFLYTPFQFGIFPAILMFLGCTSGYYAIRKKASGIGPLCLGYIILLIYYLACGEMRSHFYYMTYLLPVFAAYGIYSTLLPEAGKKKSEDEEYRDKVLPSGNWAPEEAENADAAGGEAAAFAAVAPGPAGGQEAAASVYVREMAPEPEPPVRDPISPVFDQTMTTPVYTPEPAVAPVANGIFPEFNLEAAVPAQSGETASPAQYGETAAPVQFGAAPVQFGEAAVPSQQEQTAAVVNEEKQDKKKSKKKKSEKKKKGNQPPVNDGVIPDMMVAQQNAIPEWRVPAGMDAGASAGMPAGSVEPEAPETGAGTIGFGGGTVPGTENTAAEAVMPDPAGNLVLEPAVEPDPAGNLVLEPAVEPDPAGNLVLEPAVEPDPAGNLVLEPAVEPDPAGNLVLEPAAEPEPAGNLVLEPAAEPEPTTGSLVLEPAAAPEPTTGSLVLEPAAAPEPTTGSLVLEPAMTSEPEDSAQDLVFDIPGAENIDAMASLNSVQAEPEPDDMLAIKKDELEAAGQIEPSAVLIDTDDELEANNDNEVLLSPVNYEPEAADDAGIVTDEDDSQLNNFLDRLDISDSIRRMSESAREDMADVIEREEESLELEKAIPTEQVYVDMDDEIEPEPVQPEPLQSQPVELQAEPVELQPEPVELQPEPVQVSEPEPLQFEPEEMQAGPIQVEVPETLQPEPLQFESEELQPEPVQVEVPETLQPEPLQFESEELQPEPLQLQPEELQPEPVQVEVPEALQPRPGELQSEAEKLRPEPIQVKVPDSLQPEPVQFESEMLQAEPVQVREPEPVQMREPEPVQMREPEPVQVIQPQPARRDEAGPDEYGKVPTIDDLERKWKRNGFAYSLEDVLETGAVSGKMTAVDDEPVIKNTDASEMEGVHTEEVVKNTARGKRSYHRITIR